MQRMHSHDPNNTVFAQVVEGRIFVRSPFALKEVAKSIPNYRWNADAKRWTYPATPTDAANIRKAYDGCVGSIEGLAVDQATLELLAQAEQLTQTVERSKRTDLPQIPGVYCTCEASVPGDAEKQENQYLCMICGKALTDMLHQRQAYALLKDRPGFAAMGMGTGKTKLYQALLDGNDAQVAVIVTTKKGRRVFPGQFAFHSARNWLVYNGVRDRKGDLKKSAPLPKYVDEARSAVATAAQHKRPVAIVVHYDVIWREPMHTFLKELIAQNDAYVIYDESHRIKAPGGKASRAADSFEKLNPQKVWGGTGSFMAHTKLDVYAQCRAVDKAHFGTNFAKFRTRYAIMGGFEDRQVVGWRNEDEFEHKLSQFVFFADTDDVLDLPPVTHITRDVELGKDARSILSQLERGFMAGVKDGTVSADNALTKLLRQQQATSGHAVLDDDGMSAEGRKVVEIDTAKKDELADLLADLPPHEKVVVFARFTHDLASIKQVVEDSGRVYGEVSGQREDLTQDAKFPEHIDVLGVQIQSGSEAVDFTAARYAVYYSLGFSLKDYEQSLRRVHRPGQTRPTIYYHLIAKSSVDEKVYAALSERKAVIQAVIDAVKGEGATE